MTISFYFDCVSPYSYVAMQLLPKQAWYGEVVYKPVSLISIMHASKNKPPGTTPHKAKWMRQDLQRLAHVHGFTFHMPSTFPFPSKFLNAAIAVQSEDKVKCITKMLFEKIFIEGDLRNEAEEVEAFLEEKGVILEAGWQDKGHAIVKQNTKEIIEHGAFGVPSFLVQQNDTTELFFGSDRLDQISYFYSKY